MLVLLLSCASAVEMSRHVSFGPPLVSRGLLFANRRTGTHEGTRIGGAAARLTRPKLRGYELNVKVSEDSRHRGMVSIMEPDRGIRGRAL